MKIVTYNINGIRSSTSKGLLEWIESEDADVVCIQEVRAREEVARGILHDEIASEQFSFFEEKKDVVLEKYFKIYNCGNVAGYAGTMVLSKKKPNDVVFGIDGEEDVEGRCMTLFFDNLAIVNCYVPNGGTRLNFKLEYFKKLTNHLHKLARKTRLIFCSDANIAHTELDLSHPKECASRTGFLPVERNLMTKLLNGNFCDVVRIVFKDQKAYTWRSYRSLGVGGGYGYKYRFDYVLVDKETVTKIQDCVILDLPFSDHMPVVATLDLNF